MPFEKGKSGNPTGRIKGTQNKITKTIKEVVLETFLNREEDKETTLASFADKYPRDFYQIAARLIPTELQANLMGKLELKKPSWYDEQSKEATVILLPQQIQQEAVGD